MKNYKVSLTALSLLILSVQQVLATHTVSSHVVSMEELENQLAEQSARRTQNIQEIQKLLHHEIVQQEVGKLVGLERVELALSTLDDETLDELACKSREVNDQLEAGLPGWAIVLIAVGVCLAILFVIMAAMLQGSG